MFYKTRHLVALSEFSHGDQHLRAGDDFFATEVDAGYYLQNGRAMPAVKAEHIAVAAVAAPPPPSERVDITSVIDPTRRELDLGTGQVVITDATLPGPYDVEKIQADPAAAHAADQTEATSSIAGDAAAPVRRTRRTPSTPGPVTGA